MLDHPRQTIDIQVMIDDGGTAPTDITADEIGHAVTVMIEHSCQTGVGQIAEIGDAVGLRGAGVHEVTLERSVVDLGSHLLREPPSYKRIMGGEPSVGPQINLPLGHRRVETGVFHGYGTLHRISQSLDQQPVDLGLEPTRVPGSPCHPHGAALGGFVLRLTKDRP